MLKSVDGKVWVAFSEYWNQKTGVNIFRKSIYQYKLSACMEHLSTDIAA